mgnify:CR=1 FL=1
MLSFWQTYYILLYLVLQYFTTNRLYLFAYNYTLFISHIVFLLFSKYLFCDIFHILYTNSLHSVLVFCFPVKNPPALYFCPATFSDRFARSGESLFAYLYFLKREYAFPSHFYRSFSHTLFPSSDSNLYSVHNFVL